MGNVFEISLQLSLDFWPDLNVGNQHPGPIKMTSGRDAKTGNVESGIQHYLQS